MVLYTSHLLKTLPSVLLSKKMTSFVKNLANQLKSREFRSYLMSTHFWGPVANYGIPIAALSDLRKDPIIISPVMTTALFLYSSIFMRFAWVVNPRNLLLLSCHMVNFCAQGAQGCRYIHFQYFGGKEKNKSRV